MTPSMTSSGGSTRRSKRNDTSSPMPLTSYALLLRPSEIFYRSRSMIQTPAQTHGGPPPKSSSPPTMSKSSSSRPSSRWHAARAGLTTGSEPTSAQSAEQRLTRIGSDVERFALHVETDLRPAALDGDPALVERMVSNLVDNAVSHNVAGGHVQISTGTSDGQGRSDGDQYRPGHPDQRN